MSTYLITGATGFLGRRIVPLLLERDPAATVHLLVRPSSVAKLDEWRARYGDRVVPLPGDLAAPGLGIASAPAAVDAVLHLGAVYDMSAGDEANDRVNVEGTRAVIELARAAGAELHHVSSVAVAGDHRGSFGEDDFDLGQGFPSPYHRTKFESEKLVREAEGLRWRVYRPAIVVGDSCTGEMDKVDGPYYFFPVFDALRRVPSMVPMVLPDTGDTNVVPVDYVAEALVELLLRPHGTGRTYHLVNPTPQSVLELYRAIARPAGAPRAVGRVPRRVVDPALRASGAGKVGVLRDTFLKQAGIPPKAFENLGFTATYTSQATQHALEGTGIEVPPLREYGPRLFGYWREQLDPARLRRRDPIAGRHVVVTGASAGIGRQTAIALGAQGARVILLARNATELEGAVEQVRESGGEASAYVCDVTDADAVDATVARILADHGHVDYLVNNAGRSIRRSVKASTGRMHDFERTMDVNYFGAVRMILALLPHMRERGFGHVVNISSIGVLARGPRFAAYVASKAALDAFTDIAATELLSDHVTFTNIHMPLVRTEMIAPTEAYDDARAISPEKAARMIIRALRDRPTRVNTPLGVVGALGRSFTPRITRRMLHQDYLTTRDSAAAKGVTV
ncbi:MULTISPECIES: SDR family oxidoreductase [Tsukamurella]|uniref:SDR family oxidoreductase n=2 Tax=Tsukamurella TaxID=2060 RepID=A0A5C5S7R9_9ACTN|nr:MULTISPECIES: SDR family oxidoreductase [Tsukamurella]NMD55363.1 SDR family oxidoreductase [Tsukamurella columbiensis]TWS30678.1 SDR family oxidoreductase [Tsukamurella conjunctivitidis]